MIHNNIRDYNDEDFPKVYGTSRNNPRKKIKLSHEIKKVRTDYKQKNFFNKIPTDLINLSLLFLNEVERTALRGVSKAFNEWNFKVEHLDLSDFTPKTISKEIDHYRFRSLELPNSSKRSAIIINKFLCKIKSKEIPVEKFTAYGLRGDNWLNKKGVKALCKFQTLTTLSRFRFTNSEDSKYLVRLVNLTELNIVLDNEIMSNISRLPNLTALYDNNSDSGDETIEFTNAGMEFIKKMHNIKVFVPRNDKITNNSLQYLPPSIETLLLSETGVKPNGLIHLSNLMNLKKLDVHNVIYDEPNNDTGLQHLKSLIHLEELICPKNMTDGAMKHLAPFTSLLKLEMCDNKINGSGFAHIKHITSLTYLKLDNTDINDKGVAHLVNFKNLTFLSLQFGNILNGVEQHLCKLTFLKTLILRQSILFNHALAHIAHNLQNLESLTIGEYIFENNLSCLSWLSKLTYLQLPRSVSRGCKENLQKALPYLQIDSLS